MFNLDNLKIRTKLILLLFVPVVALLLFSSVGLSQRNDTAARATKDKKIVEASAATAELATALQHEAIATVATVAGAEDVGDLATLQAETDDAAENFIETNDKLDLGGSSAAVNSVSSLFSSLETKIENLPTERTRVEDRRAQGEWFDALEDFRTNLINGFVDYVQELAKLTTTPEVVLPLEQLAALLDYNLQVTALGAATVAAQTDGEAAWTTDVATETRGLEKTARDVVFERAADVDKKNAVLIRVAGSGPIKSYIDKNASLGGNLSLVYGAWTIPSTMDGGGSFTVPRSDLAYPGGDKKVTVDEVQDYTTKLAAAATDLTDRTVTHIENERSDAVKNARLYVLLGGLAIVAAIAAAIVITVSITKRLAKLTEAAERLSHEQLPRLVDSLTNPAEDDVSYLASSFTEIDVAGTDEIGQLAGAFNRIQSVAVEVATEQAQLLRKGIGDMFVNLARRNQSLLDRQIEFIDELENAEEDPDQLENLFRLDHLATRMRRNAESLLVLAGAEPSRRRGRPVPLADVVRAAVGEVEDFARIDMLQFDEVLVASNAALDIAHLLSELMENAANFSPPDSRVEVVGHRTKAEGYVISVTDHGIGMTPEAIAESNDLLARPPLVGLALSRSLGFIVIGRLAARFGIAVRLMPSPTSGTTAMVSLPPTLISEQPQTGTGPGEITETAAEPGIPPATDDARSVARGTDRRPARRPAPTRPATPQGHGATPGDDRPDAGAPSGPRPSRGPGSLPTRGGSGDLPTRGGSDTGMPRRGADVGQPAPTASSPTDGVAVADGPAEVTTASGLAKRVPRSAGAQRAVPGGDGKRAATQNRRSPEEVRSMLSRYRSGMQKGRAEDDAEGGPETTPEESGQ